MSRAPRPLTSKFLPRDLVEDWTPIAQVRNPGFLWDGSDYDCPKRSQLGDVSQLLARQEPLKLLIKHAPTGFPSHPNLRSALGSLQVKFQIFGTDIGNTSRVVMESADRWRIMMRNLYNRKRLGEDDSALAPLLDGITLPVGPATGPVEPLGPQKKQ